LEVKLNTGYSILSYHKAQKKQRSFNIAKIGLELSREEMYENINTRVEKMMTLGLLQESEQLINYKKLNALQTVGYREVFDYLENRSSLDETVELIKKNTRHYAKRQITWFKKDNTVRWFRPDDLTNFKKITES
jgi:tRNA dimethylallyltransferase